MPMVADTYTYAFNGRPFGISFIIVIRFVIEIQPSQSSLFMSIKVNFAPKRIVVTGPHDEFSPQLEQQIFK